jgi:S-adenosylmethionine hydrolase
VLLDAAGPDVAGAASVAGRPVTVGRTFGDVPDGGLLLYEDSSGTLALAVNRGSARAALGLELDDEVRIA